MQESAAAKKNRSPNTSIGISLGRSVRTVRLSGAIICTEGRLWITVEHDFTDHIIQAGETYTPPPGRKAIAMGLPLGSFITICAF